MLEQLWDRFRQGDRLALSRLLTLVSRGEQLEAIARLLAWDPTSVASPGSSVGSSVIVDSPLAPPTAASTARVIAVTGNSGVGKSTLIGKWIELLRNQERTVAVLACDPQSTLTGGALLGDRVRMPGLHQDPGVFIRSLAVPSGHQAIAEHLDLMTQLLRQFGFDVILLETVGAGQGDTAVRQAADVVVLLVQPETGDELQWEKAGVLEVADVVVVQKADLPGAERVEAQVRQLLNLPGCREVPVLRVSAVRNEGLDQLWALTETLS